MTAPSLKKIPSNSQCFGRLNREKFENIQKGTHYVSIKYKREGAREIQVFRPMSPTHKEAFSCNRYEPVTSDFYIDVSQDDKSNFDPSEQEPVRLEDFPQAKAYLEKKPDVVVLEIEVAKNGVTTKKILPLVKLAGFVRNGDKAFFEDHIRTLKSKPKNSFTRDALPSAPQPASNKPLGITARNASDLSKQLTAK